MPDIIGKDKNQMTIMIENREIIVESASLIRTMDTGCDVLSAVMPWQLGLDSEIDRITAPYSYSPAKIYIGGSLVSEMILYDIEHITNSRGTVKNLTFASKLADIVDSTIIPPYEMNNVKLTTRCEQQCFPFGISVIVGDDAAAAMNETRKKIVTVQKREVITYNIDLSNQTINQRYILTPTKKSKYVTDEKKFPRVKAEPTDTIFKHLAKLATQRGVLLSCTKEGDLLITTANIKSKPVGTIEEGDSYLSDEYKIKFAGRDRYNKYRALVKSSGSTKVTSTQTAIDKTVKAPRMMTFQANDEIPGGAKNAAIWRKNKSAADALSSSFPVSSWYAPNEKLWTPNTTVTIISKTMGLKKGFTFLITRVEYKYETGGSTAVLELKPPSMYSQSAELEEPWLV